MARAISSRKTQIENLEDLLKEKDNQLDGARSRLSAMQAHHSTSEGTLSSLEEAISDKDKQIVQLREQRDRAEQDRNEDRELHDRELAEYKMKLHALDSEMEKLQVNSGARKPSLEPRARVSRYARHSRTLCSASSASA